MLFISFALLLPFCICGAGALVFLFKRHKSVPQKLMLTLNILCFVYFFADTLLLDSSSNEPLSWISMVSFSALRQFIGPILLPVLLLFIRSMLCTNFFSWTTGFLFLPSAILGSVCFVLFLLMDPNLVNSYIAQANDANGLQTEFLAVPIYHLHYLFARPIYMSLMLVEMLYIIGYLIYIMHKSGYTLTSMSRLFRTGGSVPVVNILAPVLIAFLLVTGGRLAMGRSTMLAHLGITSTCNFIMAILIIVVNYLMLYANRSPVTLRMLRSPLSSADSAKHYHYSVDKSNSNTPIEGMNALSYAELIDGFNALIMVERIYLEPALTIEDVALRLHSNRTYVSCMISKEFSMNFRDYIGSLRVQYAQKYMKQHNSATQEEIAQACGFTSASTFNKKFRQVTGLSPRQWQVNN